MRDYTVRLFERLIAIAETIGAKVIITVTGRVNPLIAPARRDLESWFGEAFRARAARSRADRRASCCWRTSRWASIRAPISSSHSPTASAVRSVGICYDIANAHFIGEDRGCRPAAGALAARASSISPTPGARPGATIRSGRAAATSPPSVQRCRRSATAGRRCWRSWPIRRWSTSSRVTGGWRQWGWAPLHA